MAEGSVDGICIGDTMFSPMQDVVVVEAVPGAGLKGDRYSDGQGRFNRGRQGVRQVTLMNARFFIGTPFRFSDSRRNIFVSGVELMWLIGREFKVGDAMLVGVAYCDPCNLPSKRAGIGTSFKETFQDCGGLVARVSQGGMIRVGDTVIPPPKGY